MQKTHIPIDTRTEPSRLARWATAIAAMLVIAPTALGAQRPAPPARPAPAPRPVVAQAPQAAPEPPEPIEPEDMPEPPEPAEAPEPPDMDFDYDFNMPAIQMDMDALRMSMPDVNVTIPPMPPMPAMAPMVWSQSMGPGLGWQSREHFDPAKETDPARRAYFEGRNFVSDSEWDKAAGKFNEIITKYSTSKIVDSALYWYAYSLKSESRYGDSYAALQRLISQYPNSRWKDDADALLVEVAGPAGQPVPPEIKQKQEEQIKLIALQSILESKPDQGVQYAREYFKPGTTTRPEFRQKVVVLLSQVDSPAATEVLVDAARNDGDQKVRKQALVMLGQRLDDKQHGDQIFTMLKDIALSNDAELAKYAVVSIAQSDSDRALQFLIQIAGSAQVKEVRKQAIAMLAQHDSPAACEALAHIYDTEKDEELKRMAIIMLAQSDCPQAVDKLMQVARTAESVELRRFAVIQLGQRDPAKAAQTLGQMYDTEKNVTIKEGIIDGLGQVLEQASDKQALHKLMDIAKNDQSIQLRKKAIFWIGQSKDPEATQFLMDLLK